MKKSLILFCVVFLLFTGCENGNFSSDEFMPNFDSNKTYLGITNNSQFTINIYFNSSLKNAWSKVLAGETITKEINLDDIKKYYKETLEELNKLEELDKEYKLYDKHYEEFRISMGKFALGLSKSFKLKLNDKDKSELTNKFIELNNKFEVLFKKNIIKDVYVWK